MPTPIETKTIAHASACAPDPVGVVLTGGGARGAYQVGVLSAINDILDPDRDPNYRNPFSIICGSSAGSINAAGLACHADKPHEGVDRLASFWANVRSDMVFRADAWSLLHTGLRWLSTLGLGWLVPSLRQGVPHSLLDNSPLRALLTDALDFEQLSVNLRDKHLNALAVTATAYTSGEHLTFYQSETQIVPWKRSLRRAIPCHIGVDHLLASSSIPFVFPAQAMLVGGGTTWCGDGSMRQLAPISPAIHLGAKKIVVIGTGHNDETYPEDHEFNPPYPSLAQMGGHTLSNIFLDGVAVDIERMERINSLLAELPLNALKNQSLRPVSAFTISPSQSIGEIAVRHYHSIPKAARTLFRVLGVSAKSGPTTGGALISYLLFESGFTQELIELGRMDTMNRLEEVKAFFKEASE